MFCFEQTKKQKKSHITQCIYSLYRLYNSVFDHADTCMNIARFLGIRHGGFTRDEIAKQIGKNANGDFTKILKPKWVIRRLCANLFLIGSGFISTD